MQYRREHRQAGPASFGAGGFTLPELLVALTIFLSVMAGVTVLFVNSVRVTRQGFQNQEAFEQSRSTLKIIERDLSRAFTSRDHGEYFQFYGTPIGFTFVGLVSASSLPTNQGHNLARVTYVMYAPSEEILETTEDAQRHTFSLLRFVEPDTDTLDIFPVEWQSGNLRSAEAPFTVADVLAVTRSDAIAAGVCAAGDVECLETIELVKKRELWIRMLAGGDAEVPSAWNNADVGVSGLPENYVVSNNLLNSERILNQETRYLATAPAIQPLGTQGGTAAFGAGQAQSYYFTYASYELLNPNSPAAKVKPLVRRYWNDLRNLSLEIPGNGVDDDGDGLVDEPTEIPGNGEDDDGNGFIDEPAIGSPLDPRLPARLTSHFTVFFESAYAGAPDFQRTFDQRIDVPTGFKRFQNLE